MQEEREAFQEIDYRRMFGPIAKWVAQIDDVDRIPELVARAYSTALCRAARSGRARAARRTCSRHRATPPTPRPTSAIAAEPRSRRHRTAARPARGGRATARDRRRRRLDAGGVGGAASRSSRQNALAGRRGVSPPGLRSTTTRPRYVGDVGIGLNPALAERVRERRPAARDRAASRRDDDRPATRCSTSRAHGRQLVHVHPGAEELGRVYQADAPDPLRHGAVRGALSATCRVEPRWRELDRAGARGVRDLAAARPDARALSTSASASRICARRLPDAIVAQRRRATHTVWVHRFWRFHDYPTPARPDERRDGLRRARRARREAAAPRPGSSSASPATATS